MSSFDDDMNRFDVLEREFKDHCANLDLDDPLVSQQVLYGCADLLGEVIEVDDRLNEYVEELKFD